MIREGKKLSIDVTDSDLKNLLDDAKPLTLDDFMKIAEGSRPTPLERVALTIKQIANFMTSTIAFALTRLAINVNDVASFKTSCDTVRPWQVFDLNSYAADYMLPRIERLIDNFNRSDFKGIPSGYESEDEWLHDIELTVRFLRYISMHDDVELTDEEYIKAKEIFGKVFVSLWE